MSRLDVSRGPQPQSRVAARTVPRLDALGTSETALRLQRLPLGASERGATRKGDRHHTISSRRGCLITVVAALAIEAATRRSVVVPLKSSKKSSNDSPLWVQLSTSNLTRTPSSVVARKSSILLTMAEHLAPAAPHAASPSCSATQPLGCLFCVRDHRAQWWICPNLHYQRLLRSRPGVTVLKTFPSSMLALSIVKSLGTSNVLQVLPGLYHRSLSCT
jgi:hypothetical protein